MQYEKSMKQIKKIIQSMAGKYRPYSIFRDFIVLAACTISNSVDKQQWQRREGMYMDIIAKYERDEADKFAEMLALMVLAYERRMSDFIGELYMTMEFGNKDAGQYFTPYNVSKLMAQMIQPQVDDNGIVKLNDPACGSGGLIVAYAETMKLADVNYQTDLKVICNDIDYDVVKMCYIQLSLLGIDAVVGQKNTLEPLDKPPGEVWYTPMHILNKAKEKHISKTNKMVASMKKVLELEREPVRELEIGQLTLF